MVRGAHVRDDQEAAEQLSLGVEQREILLVGAHREDQAFLRHGQKLSLELAHIDGGMLDQRGHFFEQVGILTQTRAQSSRRLHQLSFDVRAPIAEVRDDLPSAISVGS